MPSLPPPSPELLSDSLLAKVPLRGGYKALGPVLLMRVLGEGGMGKVYLGHHERLMAEVAVKCLSQRLVLNDEVVRRFEREARVAARLTHPNVVIVHDVNVEHDVHYLVMEFVAGETVAARLEREGPLPERQALAIALGAARGLAHAHANDCVHRDVKPGNLLIDDLGHVKVADFGLVKPPPRSSSDRITGPADLGWGSLDYAAPEQWFAFSEVGPGADVYALGATLFDLLVGYAVEQVGGKRRVKVRRQSFPDLSPIRPDVSPATRALVLRCCEVEPEKRPADGRAVVLQLEQLLRESDPHSAPSTPRRRPWAVVGLLAAIASVFGMAATSRGLVWGPAMGVAPSSDEHAGPSNESSRPVAREPAGPVSPATSAELQALQAAIGHATRAHARFVDELSAAQAAAAQIEVSPSETDRVSVGAGERIGPILSRHFEQGRRFVDGAQALQTALSAQDRPETLSRSRVEELVVELGIVEADFEQGSEQLSCVAELVEVLGPSARIRESARAVDWAALGGTTERLLAPLARQDSSVDQALAVGDLLAARESATTALPAHRLLETSIGALGPALEAAEDWARLTAQVAAVGFPTSAAPEGRSEGLERAWAAADAADYQSFTAAQLALADELVQRVSALGRVLALDRAFDLELEAWQEELARDSSQARPPCREAARLAADAACGDRERARGAACAAPQELALRAVEDMQQALHRLRLAAASVDRQVPRLLFAAPPAGQYPLLDLPEVVLEFDEALESVRLQGQTMALDAEGRIAALRPVLSESLSNLAFEATDRCGNVLSGILPLSCFDLRVPAWAELLEALPHPEAVGSAADRQRMVDTGWVWRVRDRDSGLELLLVPPGTFRRGASEGDREADADEVPAYEVRVNAPFYLTRTEVTEREWARILGDATAPTADAQLPVVHVSLRDILAVLGAGGLRLPRESEWEYACRAGGAGSRYGPVAAIAWTKENSRARVQPVGSKRANPWGFADLLGNVWEWCSNDYDRKAHTVLEEAGWLESIDDDRLRGQSGVARGGAWTSPSSSARASSRLECTKASSTADVGLRLARDP
jgi:serine/threonine protein kinase/formylglycine-generating enzyme required for sulfatase activity